jgi:hypothetical protein
MSTSTQDDTHETTQSTSASSDHTPPSTASSIRTASSTTSPTVASTASHDTSITSSPDVSANPAPTQSDCWAYPNECLSEGNGASCPGRSCEKQEDCLSPYPCIDVGGGSSVCASYGILRNSMSQPTLTGLICNSTSSV